MAGYDGCAILPVAACSPDRVLYVCTAMIVTKTDQGIYVTKTVAEDYRTARVFEKHGIDFCCGGKVALADIYREKGIDISLVLEDLQNRGGAVRKFRQRILSL